MVIALAAIGSLLIAASLFLAGRTNRWKATALTAVGAAFILTYNIVAGHQFWVGVAALGVTLLAGATVSYYREDRRTGGAR